MRNKILYNKYFRIIVVISVIIIINLLCSLKYFRIDLTSEKKYTLSPTALKIIKSLDEPVYFHVYLDGDLPAGFKRLQRSVSELLDEFKAYNKKNIQFKFINLNDIKDEKEKQSIIEVIVNKDIQPVNINVRDKNGGTTQKLIFPGIIVAYSGRDISLNILENNQLLSGEENLNNSIENLEYYFIYAINRIIKTKKQKIAFIEGHGELNEYEVADITRELSQDYKIDRVTINGLSGVLKEYSLIIIAAPVEMFNEKDKFIIDQYLMQGGKILWYLDAVEVFADSLAKYGTTYGVPVDVNLEDMLFRYGLRINPVLVQDEQCAIIPVNTSMPGQASKFVPAPWLYFPLLTGNLNHPITKNLNLIKSEYLNTIDTVGENKELKKTVLLQSSMYSRIKRMPSYISLSEVMENQGEIDFNMQFLPVALLLEGRFESVFRNRKISNFTNNIKDFKDKSLPTKMIVIADGNIIRNNIRQKPDGLLIEPIGYDRYTNQTYGNKDFILNTVSYLTDESGLIELRSRTITLRLLNKPVVAKNRFLIQILSVFLPVAIVILFGIIYHLFRIRKYSIKIL